MEDATKNNPLDATSASPEPSGSPETGAQEPKRMFQGEYIFAVGRRKRATARVRLFQNPQEKKGQMIVNQKEWHKYFPTKELQDMVIAPLAVCGMEQSMAAFITVLGGGIRGQAESCRLGIARALLKLNPDLRASLKPHGFLTRDPREKERKKPGLKRARRAPQWSKR